MDLTIVLFAVAVVALITWGPTVLVFTRKRQQREAVGPLHLTCALALELAAVAGIALAAHTLGLLDLGAFLLAIALLVGAAGAQAFSSMRFGG